MRKKHILYVVSAFLLTAAMVFFSIFLKLHFQKPVTAEDLLPKPVSELEEDMTEKEGESDSGASYDDEQSGELDRRVSQAIEEIRHPEGNDVTNVDFGISEEDRDNTGSASDPDNPTGSDGNSAESGKQGENRSSTGNRGTATTKAGQKTTKAETTRQNPVSTGKASDVTVTTAERPDFGKSGTTKSSSTYRSPIDFTALRKEGPDIVAWLDLPGTEISYPVVHRKGDNDYYLRRDIYGNYSKYGSLFIEDYNREDFGDNVTVIYGHNTSNGKMLGSLQAIYANPSSIKSKGTINVYTPTAKKTYKIYAALITDDVHILANHDFSNKSEFDAYFNSLENTRTLTANFNEAYKPEYGDKVLILSTCVDGDSSKRFIVVAKQV